LRRANREQEAKCILDEAMKQIKKYDDLKHLVRRLEDLEE
jgi:hypothetical protein